MHNHLSVADLGYCLPDGSSLFSSLNFKFNLARTGLIGANGVGKTTLIEILVGRLSPTTGTVTQSGKISYLQQCLQISSEMTLVELLRYGAEMAAHDRITRGEGSLTDFELIDKLWDLPELIERAQARLGIAYLPLHQLAGSLSGGELTRARIAGLLLREPDFLILDEPTNNLDGTAREFIYRLIDSWRKGLLVVSHDRQLLSYVDQIVEMSNSGLKSYGGNFQFYQQQREIEKAAAAQALVSAKQRLLDVKATAQRAKERQDRRNSAGKKRAVKQNLPPIIVGSLRRHAEVSTGKLQGRHEMKVAQARQVMQTAKENLPVDNQIIIDLDSSLVPDQKRMIEAMAINYRYADASKILWPEPLDFTIIGPARIAIKGPNGAGKSTLIDLICGKKIPTTGEIKTNSNRVALLDQRVSILDDNLTILENLKRVAPTGKEHELRILLGRFLFYHDEVFKPAGVLSGGERMRAGLACLLGTDQAPEILIVDEPTNNLDLLSIEALVSALNSFRGVLLAISHDSSFLAEINISESIDLAPTEN